MTGFNKLVCACALLEDQFAAGLCSKHTPNLYPSLLIEDVNRLKATSTPDEFLAALPSHVRRLNREAPQPRPDKGYTTVIVDWTKLYPRRRESFQRIGKDLKIRLEQYFKNHYFTKTEPLIWDVYVSCLHSPSDAIDNRGGVGQYCQHRCAVEVALEAARTFVRDVESGRFNVVTRKQDYEMNTVHYNMNKLAELPLLPALPSKRGQKRALGRATSLSIPPLAETGEAEASTSGELPPSVACPLPQVENESSKDVEGDTCAPEAPELTQQQPTVGSSKPHRACLAAPRTAFPIARPPLVQRIPLPPRPTAASVSLSTIAALYGLPVVALPRPLPQRPPKTVAPESDGQEVCYIPRWLAAARVQGEAKTPSKEKAVPGVNRRTPIQQDPPRSLLPTPPSPPSMLPATSSLKRPREESAGPSTEQEAKKPKTERSPLPSSLPIRRTVKRLSPIIVPPEAKGTVVDLTEGEE